MAAPEEALRVLAAELRAEATVISPHVADPTAEPLLGMLAAAGPRAASDPGAYALVFESVREGYLLHFGDPRVVRGADADLALLAGDYLYALGLERLAGLGDLEAVRELSDLISLSAQLHADAAADGEAARALWGAAAVAVAAGADDAHEQAKSALRTGGADAARTLADTARRRAQAAGMTAHLGRVADAIDF